MANIINLTFVHSVIKEEDKVQILSFKGQEAVSQLYQFDIELLSVNPDLDIDAMLEKQASFSIEIDDEKRTIQVVQIRGNFSRVPNVMLSDLGYGSITPSSPAINRRHWVIHWQP